MVLVVGYGANVDSTCDRGRAFSGYRDSHFSGKHYQKNVTMTEPINAAFINGTTNRDPRGPWMQMYSGRQVFPFRFSQEDAMGIVDIAHSLSLICRFTGHCRKFYSVAEHSIRVAERLPLELKLQGLLHDAAEAFLGDVASPMKSVTRLGSAPFQALENYIESKIARANNLPFPFDPRVKRADLVLLATEKRDLMSKSPAPWIDLPEPLPGTILPMSAQCARQYFLLDYKKYGGTCDV